MRVQLVPIEAIHVLNARSRNKARFREIVENIGRVGLKKPITVSRRRDEAGFDLVCGQGRLEAFIACGATEIPALVVELEIEERLLRSLVENLTRRTPPSLEMARDISALKTRGHTHADIAALIGVSESYVRQLLRLVECGEERLVAAVERGDIPVTVAMEIAATDDATLQQSLQDAYDSGKLRGAALLKVRRLADARRARGREIGTRPPREGKPPSTHDLLRTLQRETQKQALLVKKARHCEERLRFVRSALGELFNDETFMQLLRAEKLDTMPKFLGELIPR